MSNEVKYQIGEVVVIEIDNFNLDALATGHGSCLFCDNFDKCDKQPSINKPCMVWCG